VNNCGGRGSPGRLPDLARGHGRPLSTRAVQQGMADRADVHHLGLVQDLDERRSAAVIGDERVQDGQDLPVRRTGLPHRPDRAVIARLEHRDVAQRGGHLLEYHVRGPQALQLAAGEGHGDRRAAPRPARRWPAVP